METLQVIRQQLSSEGVKNRFKQLLGERKAEQFISSALSIVQNNGLLSKAEPSTVLNSLAIAASLDLPINQNLGFAWIVPYKGQAQFQMGWKGLVQLALRSGQYLRLNCVEVYENQFKSFNTLTEELEADFSQDPQGKVVGYAAYFKLVNGFEKQTYWSIAQVKKHASKYSQTYNKKGRNGSLIHSPWNDESQFDAMAKKTVLKNTLSKWGIMTVDLQTATLADQSVQTEEGEYTYVDNQPQSPEDKKANEEAARMEKLIRNANTSEELEMLEQSIEGAEQVAMFEEIKTKVAQEAAKSYISAT